METDNQTRLNKHLALQLGVSRREADNLINNGQVTINGTRAILGARIAPSDTIKVKGQPLGAGTQLQYVLFNKPKGYVCSRKAQGEVPTIYSVLPAEFKPLKPVGRLDKDSSGLILLTNDGDFAYQMTHPKFYKTKVYHVSLDTELQPLHQQMIADFGVDLPDGKSQFSLMRLSDTQRKDWQVTMSEGRNRQIRRTFAALGYEVTALHRIQFGNYSLGDIKSGDHKVTNIR